MCCRSTVDHHIHIVLVDVVDGVQSCNQEILKGVDCLDHSAAAAAAAPAAAWLLLWWCWKCQRVLLWVAPLMPVVVPLLLLVLLLFFVPVICLVADWLSCWVLQIADLHPAVLCYVSWPMAFVAHILALSLVAFCSCWSCRSRSLSFLL